MYIISDVIAFLVAHYQLFLLLPIILAFRAEKHYIGRASILANTVGMFASVAPRWNEVSWVGNINGFPVFKAYLIVGLFFGGIAFFSYVFEVESDEDFYWLAWVFYNSVISGIVCLLAAIYL